MKETILSQVKLADNREIRILRIETGAGSMIRLGAHLLPEGKAMSGVTFPEGQLKAVIAALREAQRA